MVISRLSQRSTADPHRRPRARAVGTSISVLVLASVSVGGAAAGASPGAGSGPTQLVSACSADSRTVGIAVAAEMAVNPKSYPGFHGHASSATWHTVLLSSGSGGPWLRSWPGDRHAYSISVAGTSSPRTSGDHAAPHNGDVLVSDALNGKVYDATVNPTGSCEHFAFSLKLTPSPGPTAAQVVLASPPRGFTMLPAGIYNGRMNEASLSVFGLYPGVPAYGELQAAGASDYLRTWHSALGVVGILVFQMKDPAAAAKLTEENATGSTHQYTVTRISKPAPGYLAVETGTLSTANGPLQITQYLVHEGSYAIAVSADLTPGTGDKAFTTTVLDKQVSRLNHLLKADSSGNAMRIAVAAGALVLLLLLAFAIRRRRVRRSAGRTAPAGRVALPEAARVRTPVAVAASVSGDPSGAAMNKVPEPAGSYFCSWCGVERPLNADSVHHCGSRDRPPAFCSTCGEALRGEACSCGTLATQLSPRN